MVVDSKEIIYITQPTKTILVIVESKERSIWWRLRTVLSIPKELVKFVIKGKAEFGVYKYLEEKK